MKRVLAAVLLFAACSCEPKPDPNRVAAVYRLKDARPAARIIAMRTLAPNASRAELAAIVRASSEASVEVRIEAARVLGQSSRPEAVDFLGAMLLEPDVRGARAGRFSVSHIDNDEVRSVAIEELSKKSDTKARAYIARAWASGGPRTRTSIGRIGPEVLANALEAETRQRLAQITSDKEDPRLPVRALAVEETAEHGTSEALAFVDAALATGQPLEAAAAARALGRVGAVEFAPQLTQAIIAQRAPIIVEAAADALLEMGSESVAPGVARALSNDSVDAASAVLTLLESVLPTDEARGEACAAVGVHLEPAFVARAARFAGAECTLPTPQPDDAPEVLVARFAAWTGASRRAPEMLERARALLDDDDASVAAWAAQWLALAGEPSDGPRLFALATTERQAVLLGRSVRDDVTQLKKDIIQAEDEEKRLSRARAGIDVPSGNVPRRLAKLLAERKTSEETEAYVPRPDSHAVLVAAAVGAARLGVDVLALGETLLSDGDVALRMVGVEMADVLEGEKGELLRRRAFENDDPRVARRMAIRNLAARREGALSQVVSLVDETPEAAGRVELALALEPHAADAVEALLHLATENDAAVPAATWALSAVDDPAVTALFIERLADSRFLGALDAAKGLRTRPGDDSVQALENAAFHPVAEVQAAAIDSLKAQKQCGFASALKPLENAFDARVRQSAQAFAAVCALK